jgi:hypothetical protein
MDHAQRSSRETSAKEEPDRICDGELLELGPEPWAMPGDPCTDAAANRRRFERLNYLKCVRLTELDDFGNPAASWECRVVDLSRGGLGVRSRRMVHKGRSILIEFPNVAGKTKLLFGVVRQSRYAEGEGYVIGVEFQAIPKTPAVRSWLDQRGLAA